MGVVVRRYIDFHILLIPTPLVSILFLQQHPYFLFIFVNVFRSCSSNYILSIKKNFAQYKQTYRQLRGSHGIHMKAAHTALYMKKHTPTYASYPAMDISCMSVVYISK